MPKPFFLFLFFTISVPLFAQEFSLDAEFDKQCKYFPYIKRFSPQVGNVDEKCDIVYAHRDGQRDLMLDFFAPASSLGASLRIPLVFIHGGGWRSGSKELDHPMARYFASRGYAVFCVDYRLSGEAIYPAGLIDVNDALCYIASKADVWHVDMKRLTIIGASSGGQMAALLGTTNGKESRYVSEKAEGRLPRIQKVVDIDGVLAFIHPDSEEGRDKLNKTSAATLWLGVPMAQDTALWNEASALNNVGCHSSDFVFINSSRKRFSAGLSETVDALRENGRSAIVFRIDDTPHTFWLFQPWAASVCGIIEGALLCE